MNITLAALAHRSIWVAWRNESRGGRTTKIPYDPRTGRPAASDDPQTWATHDEAAWWSAKEHADGVGLMLFGIGDAFLCGCDLDRCRDPDAGAVTPWAQEIIDRLNTYSEVSPSSTGVKLFFAVADADAAAVEALFGGRHGRSFKNGAGGDHPPAIEVHRGRRYFTVTNESIGPTDELRLVGVDDLKWLVDEIGPRFAGNGSAKRGNGADKSRSAAAWRVGAMLKASGASYEEMRDALLGHQDPDIAEWARTKGLDNGERELRRIYGKAGAGRPQVEVPDAGGELLPVMGLLDEHLSTDESEPPMRSPTGWPVEVRASEPTGMHELTAAGANAEEDGDRLPAPRLYTLAPHTQCSMALTVERYVGFYKKIKSKDEKTTVEVPKRLPSAYVTHYLNYDRSRLPRVAALATMPLVLPNGQLLATNGLDRDRRIVFRIDPEIVAVMPVGRVTGAEVAEAMKFLTNEWLVDVQTDYDGKCVLIALALTIVERELFGERPAFFATAGKRGGGKTTALNMVALAVLGKRAPAVPWSKSEEERRKAIFAALLQSVPYIVFDNIAAGSTISCPVVEEMLTASEMEDRVLGESRRDRASCTTIPAFTGNNILPKGDLASRSLEVRITVDRPDPENRAFIHPDPFAWTLNHRRQIIAALYTVLIGNPRLHKRDAVLKTRFKPWWRMVGSAIEYAAEKAERSVDFGALFLKVEEKDEEALGLADALRHLDKKAESKPFKAAEVLTWANLDTDEGRALRAFLGGSAARPLTANAITRRLNEKKDAPTRVDDGVWTLTSTTVTVGNVAQFGIAKETRQAHMEGL